MEKDGTADVSPETGKPGGFQFPAGLFRIGGQGLSPIHYTDPAAGPTEGNAMKLIPVRILIFNVLYVATILIMRLYDEYAYSEQALHAWAHAGVAIFIVVTFFKLNALYLTVEFVFWGLGFWKKATSVFNFIFPVLSYLVILLGYLLVVFLAN